METTTANTPPRELPSGTAVPIVGIGASAGGLEAFKELFQFLPADTGMAYVCIQHLAPTHESLLPGLLAAATPMSVSEARDTMVIESNHVYVIPPNTNMTLEQGRLKLLPRTESDGQHLSINTFLCSLADSQKRQAMGVILSGTASDGTRGLQAIKAEGGITFAQDSASAKHHGMPQSAITAGYVDFIGSPEGIATELTRISRLPYVHKSNAEETDEGFSEGEPEFQKVLRVLRQKTGVDFFSYKPTTLNRRIQRRMALQQIESVAEYLIYLQDSEGELEALYQDVLIGVTSFFRDPATYHELARAVFPRLVAAKSPLDSIRVWVAGCSTGEEVFSLAICLLEFLAERSLTIPIQLFGTDVNPTAITHARAGIYPSAATSGVSPERLRRFFLKVNGSYQISKSIREICVFAQHNIFKDAPFSRLDLLSCQNVLIYLGAGIQKKVMQTFHYALNPHGFLLLGHSETIGSASTLFAHTDTEAKVYMKKITEARPTFDRTVSRAEEATAAPRAEGDRMSDKAGMREFDTLGEADHLLLARYAPTSVVIDATMEILHFRGQTSRYLEPAPGKASFQLLKMARAGLGLPLRTAIHKASRSGQPVKKENIRLSSTGSDLLVTVEVIPLKAHAMERHFLILFEEAGASASLPTSPPAPGDQRAAGAKRGSQDRFRKQLEQELAATREDMRSIVEAMETATEELQAANEELLSGNEELQSLNEELETSKEEIQSSNEELLIVNQEQQQRNAQVHAAQIYAEAIVEAIGEPLLVLDAGLRVKTANRSFYQFFQVSPEETEQQIIFELGNGQWNIPALRILLEDLLPRDRSFKNYEMEHTFPRIGRKTLTLNAHRIDGDPLILLALGNITEQKQAEAEKQKLLAQREEFLRIASHELKTPLTSLKGYTQLLHMRFTKAGDKQSAELLTRMDARLNKLNRLINDLLDVTKIETGQLSWPTELFDLPTLVRELVEELGHTTETHQIRLEGAVHTSVYGNRERTGQVLTNLLSNAIKYSPQAETILVKVRADTDTATVSVQDFGIGIAPEKQKHLGERFFRVSDANHDTFPGLGLGLYISTEIVKRQGGQLWVESSSGAGATFFFTIPVRQEPEPGKIREEEGQHV